MIFRICYWSKVNPNRMRIMRRISRSYYRRWCNHLWWSSLGTITLEIYHLGMSLLLGLPRRMCWNSRILLTFRLIMRQYVIRTMHQWKSRNQLKVRFGLVSCMLAVGACRRWWKEINIICKRRILGNLIHDIKGNILKLLGYYCTFCWKESSNRKEGWTSIRFVLILALMLIIH